MSVIWSGVTEEGAVVPVQVTDEGKVVAVGDGPQGDYLPITGGNLTGDLTLGTDKIALNATDGSAVFSGDVTIDKTTTGPTDIGARFIKGSSVQLLSLDCVGGSSSDIAYQINNNLTPRYQVSANGDVRIGDIFFGAPNISLNADGSAVFSGDVVIGSRGDKWLIRESNGVAMLVKQSRDAAPMSGVSEVIPDKVRDIPSELDLIEMALNEVMEKLRMTPPAGWPVWDGSDNP